MNNACEMCGAKIGVTRRFCVECAKERQRVRNRRYQKELKSGLAKKDCFAYFNGVCDALENIECKNCTFYATKEEANAKREKANVRRADQGFVPWEIWKEGE